MTNEKEKADRGIKREAVRAVLRWRMKKINFPKICGVDTILCGIAGAIAGFLVGGILPALLGGVVGIVVGHLLERDLGKL